MSEKEKPLDIMKIVKDLASVLPIYSDTAITAFVIYRNIYSGANTITRSGLSSPGDGLLREFPTFGANGKAIGQGNKSGTTDFGRNKVYTTEQENLGNIEESTNDNKDLTAPTDTTATQNNNSNSNLPPKQPWYIPP